MWRSAHGRARAGLAAAAAVVAFSAMLGGGDARAETAVDVDSGFVMGVELGMPLARARELVRGVDWAYEPSFMADISADCASYGGELLFCAIVLAGPYDPSAPIAGFVVLSPEIVARGGVHVGMPLDAAREIWGAPTLSFHWANEGREFISFPDAPSGVVARGGDAEPGLETFSRHFGVYSDATADQEYHSTQKYQPGTTIGSLWVF